MSIQERPLTQSPACEELSFGLRVGGMRVQAKSILPPGTGLTGYSPTLVFLHEGLGSITQWRTFPLAVAQVTGLPALVYDRLGHGQSADHPGPWTASYLETEACERLPEVLAACGIELPILIGHSDGASIALLHAARYPDSPLAVIAEAGLCFVEDHCLESIWRTMHAFLTAHLRDRLRVHHGDRVDTLFHDWSEVWLSPEFRDWSLVHLLPAIQCPVLALQGQDDEFATPDQVRAILQGVSGPAEAMLLPNCRHLPHVQARERVLARISQFIAPLAARARVRPNLGMHA